MAPSAAPTTRLGRVLHLLFPSWEAIIAAVGIEVAAFLVGFPLPLHLVVAAAHLAMVLVERLAS